MLNRLWFVCTQLCMYISKLVPWLVSTIKVCCGWQSVMIHDVNGPMTDRWMAGFIICQYLQHDRSNPYTIHQIISPAQGSSSSRSNKLLYYTYIYINILPQGQRFVVNGKHILICEQLSWYIPIGPQFPTLFVQGNYPVNGIVLSLLHETAKTEVLSYRDRSMAHKRSF